MTDSKLKRIYAFDNDMLTTVLMALYDAARIARREAQASSTQVARDTQTQSANRYEAAEAWLNDYDNWTVVREPQLNGAASPSAE